MKAAAGALPTQVALVSWGRRGESFSWGQQLLGGRAGASRSSWRLGPAFLLLMDAASLLQVDSPKRPVALELGSIVS